MPKTWIRDISYWTALIIIILILLDPIVDGFPLGILSWDTFGYYLYLPQTFIEGDIALQDQEHIDKVFELYHPSSFKYQFHLLENGNYVIQYSSGVAIMAMPFFFIGHFFAWVGNYPMDGFSLPYVYAYLAANYFYMILGVFLLRKALLQFFKPAVTTILLILICLGTNYFTINIANPGLSHVFLFPLYCGVILKTVQWYKHYKTRDLIILSVLIALIILTRPLDGLIVLFPIFFKVDSFESLKFRLNEIYQRYQVILLAMLVGFAICSIQLIYWKLVSGNFLVNSYKNPEEGLYLNDPNLFRFLFSYRNGWFVYTPLMLMAILGFIVKNKERGKWLLAVSIFSLLIIYFSSCWSTWWYGHSFGQRTMIQSYPLLALPLGSLLIWITKRKWRKVLFTPLLTSLVILNVFQSYQFKRTVIHGSRMTKAYYWAVFGKWDVSAEERKLMLVNRDEPVFRADDHIFHKRFTQKNSYQNPLKLDAKREFSDVLKFNFNESSNNYYAWYKIESDFLIPPESNPADIFLTARFFSKNRAYGATYQSLNEATQLTKDRWFHFSFMYITPTMRSQNDRFEVMIWNRGQEVTYKNLRVTAFVPKN